MTEEYKINKYIFATIFIIGIIYLIIILIQNGADMVKPYKNISCPNTNKIPCKIPAEKPTQTKQYEYLQPGESKTTSNINLEIAKKFNNRILYSLIIGIIINHILHNRKYKFRKNKKKN